MARTDRAYRKMMRRKTMLCAEKDYRDILLRDCQEWARKKTDAYRTQLMQIHPPICSALHSFLRIIAPFRQHLHA